MITVGSRISEAIRTRALELRQQSTPAEKALWNRLRNRQLGGLKFRRQCPIGRYIVDFICRTSALVVEVDGAAHLGREPEDLDRTGWLTAQGFRVLRFTNAEVLVDIEEVLQEIIRACGRENSVDTLPLTRAGGVKNEGRES